MIKEKILLIFDKLNLLITKVAAYFNYPFICYLSILISLKRHNFFTKRKKKNILVLYRSLGIFDLEKFNDINQSHSLFILPRFHLKIIFHIFFKDLNHSINDNDYLTKNIHIENKKKFYRDFLSKVLFYLNKKFNFSSILSFNFRYYAERELHFAAKNNKIKFVCLHKESLVFPGEIEPYYELLKSYGKYGGDYILFYNNDLKNILSKTLVASPKNLKVIGMPRADYYFRKKIKPKSKKFILIFLINPKRMIHIMKKKYLKNLKVDLKQLNWSQLSYNLIDNVLKFAKKNPEVEFIFKTKKLFMKDVNLNQKSQESMVCNAKLKNCKLAFGGDSRQLIEKSKCVIGFNSTTLIESLILKKPIIVPTFGIKKIILKNFTLNLKNSAFYAKNQKELNKVLNDVVTGKINRTKAGKKVLRNIITKYLGNNDGRSSKRLINYLI
tara:strand:- start:1086 stop:2405 length:1320 start_codon:yes stop_codon:yes gene_type:complete